MRRVSCGFIGKYTTAKEVENNTCVRPDSCGMGFDEVVGEEKMDELRSAEEVTECVDSLQATQAPGAIRDISRPKSEG